jgi:hypothetical protein
MGMTRTKGVAAALVAILSVCFWNSAASAAVVPRSPDFNGDGYADLAATAQTEEVNGHKGAGAVNVLHGSASGLKGNGSQIWHQDTQGVQGTAEPSDIFGASLATADFNRDGFTDLAAAAPNETNGRGLVHVLYGSRSGLTATGNQLWHQDTTGIEGKAEAGDYFGSALAAGDFDGDGYMDLAVAAYNESVGDVLGAGLVHVIRGSSKGLTATGNTIWNQDTPGVEGSGGYFFGSSLASGNFNGDRYADLAASSPDDSEAGAGFAGTVNVLYGSGSGLSAGADQLWHQGTVGIASEPGQNEAFGANLTARDFTGDGKEDLAVGVPHENVDSWNVGAVHIIRGSSSGLTATGSMLLINDFDGAKHTDRQYVADFGFAFAGADLNKDGRADLIISDLGEPVTGSNTDGVVKVFFGAAQGVQTTAGRTWHRATPGIAGGIGSHFGGSFATGDYDRDGAIDLAIGGPRSTVNNLDMAGSLNVLRGSASGPTAQGSQLWHQNSPGVAGVAESRDLFGQALR